MNSTEKNNTTETIQTSRLILEPFCQRHLTQKYVDWLNDLEVVRFSEQRHRKHTRESCQAYLESFAGTDHCFWAILLSEEPCEHIGNANAYVDSVNQVADVGILIGRKDLWGRGFATEAWAEICEYLLRTRSLRKVTGGALATNESMLEVMKRAGMVPDGRRKRQSFWEGKEVDIIHMARFQAEEGG